ncbi:hypothetical protein ACQPU1_13690 [Clostridium paraputrificum]|uniref:hypothetical protein n=1 Tax=Clostridium TaxID=1485 RepID=UPI003D32ADEB
MMGKTLIINMNDVHIEGDILDLSGENTGVIYNMSKEVEEEVAIDYVSEESKYELKERKYDACTFFFNLNNIWGGRRKESIIREVSSYLKEEGSIYIWDVNKERGKIIDNKVKVLLPNEKVKEVEFKNYNPLITCTFEEVKKILEKYYKIEETKVWEDIFFIKGVRI